MAELNCQEKLGGLSGQQLDNLRKLATAIEKQAAVILCIWFQRNGMPIEVVGDFLRGVAEGQEAEVLQTIGEVGQKFICLDCL